MSDKILDEEIIEEAEPPTVNELIAHLVQDVMTGNGPDDVASEFVEEFVLPSREETGQILSLLESDSAGIVGLLKNFVGQSYQESLNALDQRGVVFIDGLKKAVKERLTELASAE